MPENNELTPKGEKPVILDAAMMSDLLTPPIHELKDPTQQINAIKCPKCGRIHFRHAGYIEAQFSVLAPRDGVLKPEVAIDSKPVKICVSCKTCIITSDSKIWDVTKYIDLSAWEKTEEEAHKATGPGGQC